ncbi:MAG: hypothetical protein WC408_00345 [Candidatus Micrarchaeia archaeon]|jgi:hypothetical protein
MQFRRGQGATEYLVILGAVLLVALVIVSLLGWFPSLGGSTKEQQSKSYWSSASPFAITTSKVSNTSMTFTVSNRLSDRLNLTSIEVQDGFGNTGTIMTPNQVFNAGEEATLSATSTVYYNASLNPCTTTGTSKTGSTYEFKVVSFVYNQNTISGIRQTGAQSLVGRCS